MDWTNVATFIPFYFLNKATTPLPLKNVAYINCRKRIEMRVEIHMRQKFCFDKFT